MCVIAAMGEGKPVTTTVLRGLSTISYLIAATVMLLSYQRIEQNSYGYEVILQCSQWSALTFFVAVNFIGFAYNLLVLAIPAGSHLWKLIVILDVVTNLAVGISLGVGWQTYSFLRNGNIYVAWSPVCGIFPHFCNEVVGSLCTCSLGFLLSFSLSMLSLTVSLDPFLVGPQS